MGLAVRVEGNGGPYCLRWKGMVRLAVRVERNGGTYC